MTEESNAFWRVEWRTLATMALCYGVWAIGTTWAAQISLGLAIAMTALAIALQSSLQHEVIHGHPTTSKTVNMALVFPAIGLLIPYIRFRDTHLDHHIDADLTDPYDDPESQYLDPVVWDGLPGWIRAVLTINNTMLGRIVFGTAISQVVFMRSDARLIRQGDRRVLQAWLWHIPAVALVAVWLSAVASMPVWTYLIAAYFGLSVIKIRTFLEHQAHARVAGRTAIVEDRGLLAFLFLNNNLHVVHHAHPGVAWYDLPALYQSRKDRYCAQNGGYVYRSYAQVFRQYFWRRKDDVPHPFWR